MSRWLNLRVSEEFAQKLERVARRTGQSMATVLEAIGTPFLDKAQADSLLDATSFAAWETYQLTGESVEAMALDGQFAAAKTRARALVRSKGRGR